MTVLRAEHSIAVGSLIREKDIFLSLLDFA